MTPDQFREIIRQELRPLEKRLGGVEKRLGGVEKAVLLVGSKLLAPEEHETLKKTVSV